MSAEHEKKLAAEAAAQLPEHARFHLATLGATLSD
jgi:hypothetical protein